MPLSSDLKSSYEVVLRDLESERAEIQTQLGALQTRLKELHASISTLARRINPDAPSIPFSPRPSQLKYSNMSVRWAILDLLSDSQKPLTTPEIATALREAGIPTQAANFTNNVSAVLSTTMKERHNEVLQSLNGAWELTERGREAIAHIRTTPKFRRATSWSA